MILNHDYTPRTEIIIQLGHTKPFGLRPCPVQHYIYEQKLSPTAEHLFWMHWDRSYIAKNTHSTIPIASIEHFIGASRSSIFRGYAELEDKGLLQRHLTRHPDNPFLAGTSIVEITIPLEHLERMLNETPDRCQGHQRIFTEVDPAPALVCSQPPEEVLNPAVPPSLADAKGATRPQDNRTAPVEGDQTPMSKPLDPLEATPSTSPISAQIADTQQPAISETNPIAPATQDQPSALTCSQAPDLSKNSAFSLQRIGSKATATLQDRQSVPAEPDQTSASAADPLELTAPDPATATRVDLETTTAAEKPLANSDHPHSVSEKTRALNKRILEIDSEIRGLKNIADCLPAKAPQITNLKQQMLKLQRERALLATAQSHLPSTTPNEALSSSDSTPNAPELSKQKRTLTDVMKDEIKARIRQLDSAVSQPKVLLEEVIYSIEQGAQSHLALDHAMNAALKLIRSRRWRTPWGFKGMMDTLRPETTGSLRPETPEGLALAL